MGIRSRGQHCRGSYEVYLMTPTNNSRYMVKAKGGFSSSMCSEAVTHCRTPLKSSAQVFFRKTYKIGTPFSSDLAVSGWAGLSTGPDPLGYDGFGAPAISGIESCGA